MRKYLGIILLLFTMAALLLLGASLAHGQVCAPGQIDMLDWMAPVVQTANSHYNVVYPTSGRFYWLKSANGYPWDYKQFDQKYIYDWITEYQWSVPTTYKAFEKPVPWMPRCVNSPTALGLIPGTSIAVPDSATAYDIHTSCTSYTTHYLGNMVNELWSVPSVNPGGNIPAGLPTIEFSYRYGCDSTYNNCTYKETFDLEKGVGLVRWTYFKLIGNTYQLQNQTFDANYQLATVPPTHPCW